MQHQLRFDGGRVPVVKANIIDQGMHEEMDFAMAGGVA